MTGAKINADVVRQALFMAALFEDARTNGDPVRLEATVRALAADKGSGPLGQGDAAARMTAAVRVAAGWIDREWLPALVDYLGAVMARLAPADGPDGLRVAAAVASLARTAGIGGEGRPATRRALSDASRHIRMGAERIYQIISDALSSPDAPDVGALSLEMLRLEALRLVADALGDRKASEEFAYISRRVARIALNRGAATIDAFLAERDLLRLFDNAAVVGRVDDMLTLALRVLDAREAEEEERTAFVEPADQAALNAFIDALSRLAEALTALAMRAAGGDSAGDAFFLPLLMQIGCVLNFCRRLRHGERPVALDALERRLVERLTLLAGRLAAAARPGRDGRLLKRAEELAGALTAMDLPDVAAPLLDLPPPF